MLCWATCSQGRAVPTQLSIAFRACRRSKGEEDWLHAPLRALESKQSELKGAVSGEPSCSLQNLNHEEAR